MPYNQNKTNYRTLFAEITQISTNTEMLFYQKKSRPFQPPLSLNDTEVTMLMNKNTLDRLSTKIFYSKKAKKV